MSARKLSRWVAASVVAFAIVLAAAPPALRTAHLHWPAWLVALILASIVALGGVIKPFVDACTQTWAKYLSADLELGHRRRSLIAEVQGDSRNLRRVSEITDRALLGIHPAIPLPHTADQTLSAELPLYVPRDMDGDLRAWLDARRNTGGLLLFVGPAATGKTRCAYELLRSTLPNWQIFMPTIASHVTEFSRTAYEGHTVIWLNEIGNFLAGDDLPVAIVRRMLADPRPVVLVGTIWPDDFDDLTQAYAGVREQVHINQDAREILTVLAHRVDLPDLFSPSERQRASQLAERDPRIAEALRHSATSNIATTLAAAPELIRRWVHGSNPYGRSVITAAVTASRCGHPQPIPETVLLPLANIFLSNADRASAITDWFPAALEWATQPVRGHAAPLMAQAVMVGKVDGYSVSDVLVQHANNSSSAPGELIQDAALRALIKNATPYACALIGAAVLSRPQIAEHAFCKAAEAGNLNGMARLGLLLAQRGDDAGAETWWRKAVEVAEDWTKPEVNLAVSGVGVLILKRGESAETWWRAAAGAGNVNGMAFLAEILHKRGGDAEAERWSAKAAEAGNSTAMVCLAEILRQRGDDAEAEAWWRKAAEAGNPKALACLAEILRQRDDDAEAEMWAAKAAEAGRTQEAASETWWRKPAEAGNPDAMARLGLLLAKRGDEAEAETWWRKTVEAAEDWTKPEVDHAVTGMGILIGTRGENAESWWRRAAEAGNLHGMACLAEILHARGDDAEAESWSAKAAEAGNPRGMACLAEILHARGDDAEAESWSAKAVEADRTQGAAGEAYWRKLAEAGDPSSMSFLAQVLDIRGDKSGAESWWRAAAEAGNPLGMACLGLLLAKRGDDAEAETWWRRTVEIMENGTKSTAGSWTKRAVDIAVPGVGILLVKRGESAENWWRAAAEAGISAAMASLAEILHQRGDDAEAESWSAKAAEAGNPNAMACLAEILHQRGDDAEAESWSAKAAEAGNPNAMDCLVEILHQRGDDTGAESWSAKAAEARRAQEAVSETQVAAGEAWWLKPPSIMAATGSPQRGAPDLAATTDETQRRK
jgi:TPR repeat protein